MALHSGFAQNFKASPWHSLSNSKKFAGRSVGELIALTRTKMTHKPMQPLEATWSLGAGSPKIVLKMIKITYKLT